jgi:hypothetical protein
MLPVCVFSVVVVVRASFAIPKSSSFTISGPPSTWWRYTLSGLRSRWTMSLACAASSARATPSRTVHASATGSRPRRSRAFRSSPRSHSITMNARPSGSSPSENTSTMFGCPIRLTACASWTNRSIDAWFAHTSGFSTLIATVLPISGWTAV